MVNAFKGAIYPKKIPHRVDFAMNMFERLVETNPLDIPIRELRTGFTKSTFRTLADDKTLGTLLHTITIESFHSIHTFLNNSILLILRIFIKAQCAYRFHYQNFTK